MDGGEQENAVGRLWHVIGVLKDERYRLYDETTNLPDPKQVLSPTHEAARFYYKRGKMDQADKVIAMLEEICYEEGPRWHFTEYPHAIPNRNPQSKRS